MSRTLTHIAPPAVVSLLVLWLTGCGPAESPDPAPIEGGEAVCSEGPLSPSGRVEPTVGQIGETSNALRRGAGYLWIVESGDNTVSRLDPASGRIDRGFIDVGNGKNPYDLAVAAEDNRVYVTNWLANSVTVADAKSGEVIDEIASDAFQNPEGVAVAGRWLYVTNANFTGGDPKYGPGSIAIVDRKTRDVVGTAPTRWKNPQFARLVETPDGPRVAITDSGGIDAMSGSDAAARPTGEGGLELWKPNGQPDVAEREAFGLRHPEGSRIGAPGRALPTPDGSHLYFTSATAPVVFKFDVRKGEWERDARDPIALYESTDDALHHGAMGANGVLYITSFNRDALYLFDTGCDERLAGPVDLGTTEELLEGPHGVAPRATDDGKTEAFYIMSHAHAVGRVRLDYQ